MRKPNLLRRWVTCIILALTILLVYFMYGKQTSGSDIRIPTTSLLCYLSLNGSQSPTVLRPVSGQYLTIPHLGLNRSSRVTAFGFGLKRHLIVNQGNRIITYNLADHRTQIIGYLGSGMLTRATWAFPVTAASFVILDKHGQLSIVESGKSLRLLIDNVTDAKFHDEHYITALCSDGRLFQVDLSDRKLNLMFAFKASELRISYAGAPGRVVIAEDNQLYIVQSSNLRSRVPLHHALNHFTGALCWLGDNTVAFGESNGLTTTINVVDVHNGEERQLFAVMSSLGNIVSGYEK
jgi:hypothetical protein